MLALETSGKEGSVAMGVWGEDGRMTVLAEAGIQDKEEQAAVLLPRIQELMSLVERGPDDVSGLVVGAGPGSFTGVRIGAATAKGLAWALGIELWAVSSLVGAALGSSEEPMRPRMVLFDARGDRLYTAAYREVRGTVETLLEPTATTVGDVLDGMIPPGSVLMGDGAQRHCDLLESQGNPVLSGEAGRPSARGLLRAVALSTGAEPLADVGGWNPEYLRVSGAERLWKAPPR
jgi:tRNA threonylcarbamoyladenosine biosynthesis protein TsaB